jgi:polar amino acid transport system substrate-binding protein
MNKPNVGRITSTICGVAALFGLAISIGCQPRSSSSTTAAADQGTLAKVKRTGHLRACYIKYPPFVMQNPATNQLSGYFIDLMSAIARDGDFTVDYEETNWGTMIAALQSAKCDTVVSGIFPTIPRAKEVAFATPLLYVGLSGIARKNDTRFRTAADLTRKGLVVAVTNGEVGHEYAKKFLPDAKLIVMETEDISRPMLEVLSGRADIALGDSMTACRFANAHPQVTDVFANGPLRVYGTTFMLKRGDSEWENFLNIGIQEMELSGITNKLEAQYKECPSAWFSKAKPWK